MGSVPINVKYECNANLGSPDVLACERALFEIDASDGQVVLDPDGLPLIRPAGNCAIAVGTSLGTKPHGSGHGGPPSSVRFHPNQWQH